MFSVTHDIYLHSRTKDVKCSWYYATCIEYRYAEFWIYMENLLFLKKQHIVHLITMIHKNVMNMQNLSQRYTTFTFSRKLSLCYQKFPTSPPKEDLHLSEYSVRNGIQCNIYTEKFVRNNRNRSYFLIVNGY